ncbi:hypothetical protein MD484_g913, partial [Candolleomyces efflorescens]
MELLVQMWCPFDDSPMDRALYLWGCGRAGCQGGDGTVRAWRGLRYNEKYAIKLERKLAKRREREQQKAEALAEEAKKKAAGKINPFSLKNSTSTPNPFGLGAQLFGDVSPSFDQGGSATTAGAAKVDDDEEFSSDDDEDSSSEKSLVTAMASTSISDNESPWKAAPSYPTLYLSTVAEYISAPPKFKLPPGTQILDPSEEDGKAGGKDVSWISEGYENSLDIDQVFDKFSKRVESEPEQCVRYELKGAPLPFSSDATFKRLFPDPKQDPLPVTKPAFNVVQPQKRVYNPSSIPPCPLCGGPRVFECQLMPNLINVLSSGSGDEKLTDEQRRKAVEKVLKKGDKDARGSMEWGTCMVFSCEEDCCLDANQKESKEAWREEYVLVQWDV